MTLPSRNLGSSDIVVPILGVGCNAFGTRIDADQTAAVVHAALDAGVTFFDTADVYGAGESEQLLGRALAGRRDEAIVATKFGMEMPGTEGERRGSADYVRRSIDASLTRLGVDHVDLYQLHTPDLLTPIDETLGALSEVVAAGKARAVGCSNMQAWQVVDAAWVSKSAGHAEFVTAQNEYSLYNRTAEVELTPACLALGVGILPYFPLAYGLLTGKYRRDQAAPEGTRLAMKAQAARLASAHWDRIEELEAFAAEREISILDVAIGGLAAQPAVTSVIAGATKPEQIAANVAAAAWTPTSDDLAALAAIGSPTQSYTTFAP